MKKEHANINEDVNMIKGKDTKNAKKKKKNNCDEDNDLNFQCDMCSFIAETENTLRKHINTKHPDLKVKIVLKMIQNVPCARTSLLPLEN